MAAKPDKPAKRANDQNGVVDSVSTSEVARRLGISSRSACRLCSTGELASFRTPGGHIRVRRKDLDEYAQRPGGAVSATAPRVEITRLSGEREQVQALNLQLQQRRLQRDLQRLDEEAAEAERKRADAVAAEHARSQAAIEQVRLQREEREQQEEEEWEKQAGFERRQQWTDRWIQYVLMNRISSPDVRSRFAGEIKASVEQALQGLDPSRAPAIVEQVVTAAARRAIELWLRHQEIENAIKRATKELPFEVRNLSDFFPPTAWESRAMAAARDAVSHLAGNVSYVEIHAAAVAAGRQVASEYAAEQARAREEQQRKRSASSKLF